MPPVSPYKDVSVRNALNAALQDGHVYEYEASAITAAALDGRNVSATERADLQNALKLEADRFDPAVTRTITQFLASCDFRKSLPKGYLDMAAPLTDGFAFHLRGKNPGDLRVTVKISGLHDEQSIPVRPDGSFAAPGFAGYISNDGKLVVTRNAYRDGWAREFSLTHEKGSPAPLKGYGDVAVRSAVNEALKDGVIHQYEVDAILNGALDSGGVTATEKKDLQRLLSFESDRFYSDNESGRVSQFLQSCDFAKALPSGALDMKSTVSVWGTDIHGKNGWAREVRFHLRGDKASELRLTYEGNVGGGPEEFGVLLNKDGSFGAPGLSGYLSNDGRVVVTNAGRFNENVPVSAALTKA